MCLNKHGRRLGLLKKVYSAQTHRPHLCLNPLCYPATIPVSVSLCCGWGVFVIHKCLYAVWDQRYAADEIPTVISLKSIRTGRCTPPTNVNLRNVLDCSQLYTLLSMFKPCTIRPRPNFTASVCTELVVFILQSVRMCHFHHSANKKNIYI